MPHKKKPRTKAGKRAKAGKVLSEFKEGTLRSGSGAPVTNRDQAIAIALSESGQSRRRPRRRRRQT